MRSRKRQKNNKGFTLIELLVVTVMLAIVSLALYSTFSSGARIWQRVSGLGINEDVNIFFDRYSTDVKNSLNFTGLSFQGGRDRFELPTIVGSQSLGVRTVGMVVYVCGRDTVSRGQADYSQIYQDSSVIPRHALYGVTACNFSYYNYDEEKKDHIWSDEWDKQYLPLAIRMDITVDKNRFVRTVNIPAGGARGKDE